MTNYEKICAYVNAWHYAVTEDENKIIRVFTSIASSGRVRYWYWHSLEEALDTAGTIREGKIWMNSRTFTRIYPLPRPIPKYKKGDKVVVLDNIEETEYADKYKVGWVYTITDISGCLSIQINGWYVLPHCVAPYFDDEIEEMTVEQICKALGKNIKIVK